MTTAADPAPTAHTGSVRSGAFDLRFRVEGEGPPALVIGSALYYARLFSPELRRHLRLAFVDHRGFATADRAVTVDDFSLDQLLADIDLVRAHLGFERIIIIGHSGHAYLALEYAKRYRRHVSHVVMVAAGPRQDAAHAELTERHWQEAVCPQRRAMLDMALARLPEAIAAAPERRFISFCLALGARSWFDPAFDAAPLWDGIDVHMTMFDHVWGEVFADLDIRDGLAELSVPLFLALGRFDYLVAPAWAWEPYRAHIRDLTLRVFDRSSHAPPFEEPGPFDAELLAWLGSRPAA